MGGREVDVLSSHGMYLIDMFLFQFSFKACDKMTGLNPVQSCKTINKLIGQLFLVPALPFQRHLNNIIYNVRISRIY